MTLNTDHPISILLELPASSLRELSNALKDGSLKYGISTGLLIPFAGEKAQALAVGLTSLMSQGCSVVALSVICEGLARTKAEEESASESLFLTISGPDIPGVPVVDTSTVVRSLFQEARRDVIIASYVFHDAANLLSPLVERCKNDSCFKVRIIVDLSHARRAPDEPLPIIAGRFRREFMEKFWQGAPEPEFWHDPRVFEMEDRIQAGVMHAKVVLIDDTAALITSANFTAAAQSRNIEAGMLIRNRHDVIRVKNYFVGLISLGHLKTVK